MLKPFLLAAFVAVPLLAVAAEPPRRIEGPVEASVVKVRDGDTVEVEAYIWPSQTVFVAVRLRGIDAPEIKGECEGERVAAAKARERLAALVGEGTVRLSRIEGDKYFGRVLADLSTRDEPNVAARLKREGLVADYDGGKRRDWCGAAGASIVGRLLGRG